MPRPIRSRVVAVLAVCKDLNQKQIGAGAGLSQKKVSYHLREGNLDDDALYARLLQGVEAREAEVQLTTAFVEAFDALGDDSGLAPEERDEVEAGVLEIARLARGLFADAVRRSRQVPPRERYLVKKGFTLEVMGEYDRAVAALLKAEPLVERQRDNRLVYMLRFNLGVNLCQLGRYPEATKLVQQVRDLAADLGDEVFLIRVVWLEGRIAAGSGRSEEGRKLLEQARREFATRKMGYDVALALLEEAVLLLESGRRAEVKDMARDLAAAFEFKGVHREALAALQLFQEAAEREEATADLARRILRFLFRARYDKGLRFTLA